MSNKFTFTEVEENGVKYIRLERKFLWKIRTVKSALKYSVLKWKVILKKLQKTKRPVDDGGTLTCALCSLFNPNTHGLDPCDECPVFGATNSRYCQGSPYVDYADEMAKKKKVFTKLVNAAKEEVIFLEKLLAAEGRKC